MRAYGGKDAAPMPTRLAELAELVRGQLLGDGQLAVRGAAPLSLAKAGEITFLDQAEKLSSLAACPAVAIVVPRDAAPTTHPAIQVDDVHLAFAAIVTYFRPPRATRRGGVSPRAVVSPSAHLEDDVEVQPHAFIGDDVEIGRGSTIHSGARIMAGCRIGEGVTVFPNAVLYEDTVVGPRCTIHAGAVLGAYGFGYKLVDGRHRISAQLGHVEIGADVEVGACSTIDRGTYGPTIVGEGTKIDNQVMIGHNCRIGRHNLLCSQVGIAGSSSTGDYVVMAGQVGVSDHVHIGERAILCAQAGVSNDVEAGAVMLGTPASPLREERKSMIVYSKLPEMRQQLRELQRAVDALRAAINTTAAAPAGEADRHAA
jgi:UDP-3-O-[3-hydroxymyristoyl] glucosamine N-acyltransferase